MKDYLVVTKSQLFNARIARACNLFFAETEQTPETGLYECRQMMLQWVSSHLLHNSSGQLDQIEQLLACGW